MAGEIGIAISDLSRLLPWEFRRMVEGYHKRLRRRREQAAEHAAWVLWPYAEGRITAADLLGDEERGETIDPAHYPTKEAFLAAVREARARRDAHVD